MMTIAITDYEYHCLYNFFSFSLTRLKTIIALVSKFDRFHLMCPKAFLDWSTPLRAVKELTKATSCSRMAIQRVH